MTVGKSTAEQVLNFWFEELGEQGWFQPPEGLDDVIRDRFSGWHREMAQGDLSGFHSSARHRLAAILVLDQFPRNMYRATPLAFATDWLALREARLLVDAGLDRELDVHSRCFSYLPFEHSEDLADQDRSVQLFSDLGDANYLEYAERHRNVVRRFGRFPHRNAYLGRQSTDVEIDYLSQPGSGF
ncbi:DUF924 family protein [Rhizobiales bacterium RZME27]|uniref:DUF924 family protein n=1 Tax=Endobacterium cereale TaxID=2663029 RepID=A0A6A8A7M0_9HYPH|nr:DUF924 family protein [Endobacterium cereale]MEB2843327.1 DUF924 family protein [Endobacterium cereale]MQY47285.1 DUF924 family protein [Endobacterium cereale]